jgi:very-short-patch-repair endonuclease
VGVKGLTGIARRLRKHSTDTEGNLWRYLRNRQIEGFKYRRQQPVGSYVVDFVNLEKKVVIEPLTLTLSPKGRGKITYDNTLIH